MTSFYLYEYDFASKLKSNLSNLVAMMLEMCQRMAVSNSARLDPIAEQLQANPLSLAIHRCLSVAFHSLLLICGNILMSDNFKSYNGIEMRKNLI